MHCQYISTFFPGCQGLTFTQPAPSPQCVVAARPHNFHHRAGHPWPLRRLYCICRRRSLRRRHSPPAPPSPSLLVSPRRPPPPWCRTTMMGQTHVSLHLARCRRLPHHVVQLLAVAGDDVCRTVAGVDGRPVVQGSRYVRSSRRSMAEVNRCIMSSRLTVAREEPPFSTQGNRGVRLSCRTTAGDKGSRRGRSS